MYNAMYTLYISIIYGMGLWTGLVPCCGQDSYRAQVPQHPIDTEL